MEDPREPSNPEPRTGRSTSLRAWDALRASAARTSVNRPITLGGAHAQAAYRRGFERLNEALVRLEEALPRICSEDESERVMDVVENMFDDAERDMRDEIARIDTLRKSFSLRVTAEFTSPLQTSVAIGSPQVGRYLNLLAEMDKLHLSVDTIWLEGRLPSKNRRTLLMNWQRRLIRLSEEIRKIGARAINADASKGVSAEADYAGAS